MAGLDPVPWVVVSDGCSTAPYSDFGARIIASSVVPYLHLQDKDAFCHSVLVEAVARCRTLGLPQNSISATLMCIALDEHYFRVKCIGDGIIATLTNDGTFAFHEIRFRHNAPFYLYYEFNEQLKSGYLERFGHIYSIHSTDNEDSWKSERKINQHKITCEEFNFARKDYKMVAVMSDGVSSFFKNVSQGTGRVSESAETKDIVTELLSFKGYAGEFVQRRMNKAMQTLKDDGYKNSDDVAVGAIVI